MTATRMGAGCSSGDAAAKGARSGGQEHVYYERGLGGPCGCNGSLLRSPPTPCGRGRVGCDPDLATPPGERWACLVSTRRSSTSSRASLREPGSLRQQPSSSGSCLPWPWVPSLGLYCHSFSARNRRK